jgi:LPXTG-motif cell wall-anchored protein
MKRMTSLALTLLALTIVAATSAQAQEPYPPGTQQPSGTADPQATAADPAQTAPSSELPATASPMPLVGLGGLVALGVGTILNRSRRRA